jgi:hypothetical protein
VNSKNERKLDKHILLAGNKRARCLGSVGGEGGATREVGGGAAEG